MNEKRYLGDFQFLVTGAVLRLGAEAYGAAVRDEVALRTGRDVSMGAVHATLRRLEAKGLMRSHLGDPRAERGGKARRFYHAEPKGVEAFHDASRAFTAMIEGVRG